jgi:hypothetical protein
MAALIHNLEPQQQLAAVELAARVALLAAVASSREWQVHREQVLREQVLRVLRGLNCPKMGHKMRENGSRTGQKSSESSLHLHLLTDLAQVEFSRDTIYIAHYFVHK